jgi:hypothetical protein
VGIGTKVIVDRDAEDANGTFGAAVAELSPDAVAMRHGIARSTPCEKR